MINPVTERQGEKRRDDKDGMVDYSNILCGGKYAHHVTFDKVES